MTVTKPTLDWGGVTHDKIGVLEKIINDDYELGKLMSCFNQITWMFVTSSKLTEHVQTLTEFQLNTLNRVFSGLSCIVILSLAGNVGLVRFPGRKLHWSCLLNELEPARYQPPNYGSHLDAEDLRVHFENMMLGGNLPF